MRADSASSENLCIGMTPDIAFIMERSENRTSTFGMFQIDHERAKDWTLDAVAKRTIAVSAMALVMFGASPLVMPVHSQPQTDRDWQLQHLQEEMKDLRNVPLEIALLQQQVKLEESRYEEQRDLESKLILGFLANIGALLLAFAVWALNQFGITVRKKETA